MKQRDFQRHFIATIILFKQNTSEKNTPLVYKNISSSVTFIQVKTET